MTRDDIISIGYEADAYANEEWDVEAPSRDWKRLRDEHFADLVAASEREACAKLCERWDSMRWSGAPEAIRARSLP
jgi:hypothetical protein